MIMGDKIVQLIFEKIKTHEIKEVNQLEGTGWGSKRYGSTGMSANKSESIQDIKTQFRRSGQSSDAVQETTNGSVQK